MGLEEIESADARGITRRALWRPSRVVPVVVALVASLVIAIQPASAEWSQPAFVTTIGGSGRPGVFAWGLQYNPVSDELLVGDYLNYQVRRFSPDGSHLGDFFRSDNQGQPYSLAVDSNDGSIYVPEIADGSIGGTVAKYDAAGNFLYAVDTNADYYAWIAIGPAGDLYIADSHYWNNAGDPPHIRRFRFNDATQTGTEIDSWTVLPSGLDVPRMYGIDVAADGTVYASDTINKTVHRWENDGTYLGGFGTGYFTGDIRSVAVDDANGFVYVVDAFGGQIEKFLLDGTYVASIGGLGPNDGQLLAPRQVTVGSAGQVFVADYGKYSVEEFDAAGTWIQSIPQPSRRPSAAHLAQPRDVDVDASGNVWVADAWNQRVQQYSSDGTWLDMWGQRGSGLYGMNYPRGIGIDPVTQNVWVSQERGHYIAVYDPTFSTKLFVVGEEGVDSASTDFLRWPNDIEFYGGNAYVGDRVSNRVKVFDTTTGDELWRISRRNHGLAVDPASGDVFVVDEVGERIFKYDSAGNELFVFGSNGTGDGQFKMPKDAVVANGLLWVTDEQLSRVQAFDLDGNFVGRWGGYGSNAYQFKNPVGIATDGSGMLYITDSGNDRIVVYDTNTAKPPYEFSRPGLTITSPTNGQAFSQQTTIAGQATDNSAIANVEVAVMDQATGLWWNSFSATWETTQMWSLAPLSGPPNARDFDWKFMGGTYGGAYEARIRARDSQNTVSNPEAVRTFAVSEESTEPDFEEPDGTVTVPANGQSFPEGTVAISGDATDNVGVTEVDVAIKDRDSGLWWTGSTWAGFTWLAADVASPGATSTPWDYTFTGSVPGSYGMSVRAHDAAGNLDTTRPWVTFTVSSGSDTIEPDGTVTVPGQNQIYPPGLVAMNGTATDNIGVERVNIAVKDKNASLWWTGSGWGNFTWLETTLSDPAAATTEWSWEFDPGLTGSFALLLRAEDTSGNVDSTRPWVSFSVSSDLVPPNVEVTTPTKQEILPVGIVDVTGVATDDVAVQRVRVAVKDRTAGLWWDGTTWGNFTWFDATLTSPGAATTDWSWTFDAGPGLYGFLVAAEDSSGNADPTKPWVPITVE